MKNRPQRLNCFLVVWLTMFSSTSGWGQNPRAFDFQAGIFNEARSFSGSPFNLLPEGFSTACCGFSTASGPAINPFAAKYRFESGRELSRPNGGCLAGPAGSLSGSGLYGHVYDQADLLHQPGDYIYLHAGFFCRKEWEMEKATHLPIRFRIGSLADCDAMEGKH